MPTKSLVTKRKSRCMTAPGLIPSNSPLPLPLSHRGSSSLVGSGRVSVGSPGAVLATPMAAADSINRSIRGRLLRIRLTSRGAAHSSKVTSKRRGTPTTGQLTERNTTRTRGVPGRVLGRNTWMSSSGSGRRSWDARWRRRGPEVFISNRRVKGSLRIGNTGGSRGSTGRTGVPMSTIMIRKNSRGSRRRMMRGTRNRGSSGSSNQGDLNSMTL